MPFFIVAGWTMQDPDLTKIVGIALALLVLFGRFIYPKRKPRPARPKDLSGPPRNAVVVDGSNVLHWGQEPSAKVLSRVLRSLEDKGYAPIVFFDANVGYVLDDHYYNEDKLAKLIGIEPEHICVVSKGVVADNAILAYSSDHGLRVVSNDRFRDWRVQFPHAARKGMLLRGNWREGSVVWRGQL